MNYYHKLNINLILYPIIRWALTLFLCVIVKYIISDTIFLCETKKHISNNISITPEWIYENTEANARLLNEYELAQRRAILFILMEFNRDIRNLCKKHDLVLFMEDGYPGASLFVATRDLLDKLIVEYSDSRVRVIIEFLVENHRAYYDPVLYHLLATYLALRANPSNIDGNGYLINSRGNIDETTYSNEFHQLNY